ncbi:MAG TPA: sigma-54 dependent transcriptional regulator [Pyrinomonadaceae bacterium]|nr:sigma-54 dependent transcriptional regulator [Pyrinomonadaceae bacterium]
MKKILVVDDDAASGELLEEIFSAQGWNTLAAQTPQRARELASQQKFDLVVSDINLEADENGLDLLRSLRKACPVILVTGFGSLETAIEATSEGAYDFISKPFKVEEVVAAARRALGGSKQAIDAAAEQTYEADQNAVQDEITGRSPAMIRLYLEIARIARSRVTVLITGESGTGKELVARSIHKHSPRAASEFVPVNCGALTETLLEAELFGAMKGSYTGANTDRKGLWEEADGGTLFLDEIGETSQAMQVKLLRALQEGEIRPVGATRSRQVDSRIIAATNKDLEAEVKAGRFREDLFYRLSVVTLHLPALRERRTDIPLLAENFLRRAVPEGERSVRLSEEALACLVAYDWAGNVRELQSAIEHAVLHARDGEITPHDLPPKLQSENVRRLAQRSPLSALYADLPTFDEMERRYLLHVMEVTNGNRSRAAEILGINRRTLYRMVERFGISFDGE